MGTIITKSDKEVLHFFDEMKRVSDLIDHLPMDKPALIGRGKLSDRYGTSRKAQAEQAYAAGLQKQRHIALLPDRRKNPIPGKRYRTTAGKEPKRSVLTSGSIYWKEGALQNVHFDAPSCCYNMYSRCTSVNSYFI